MRDVVRRSSWGFVDQALSSASNFAFGVFVAATVSAQDFGAFTIVYAIYGLWIGVSAGLASIPLVVGYSATPPDRFRPASRASVGTALAVSAPGVVGCLVAANFTSPVISGPLLALAVVLPGLCVQDGWRYSFLAGGHPERAALNDGIWVAVQVLATAAVIALDGLSVTAMILAWGGAGTVAALVGVRQAGVTPAPGRTLAWLNEQRVLGPRYAIESVAHRSGGWLALAVVGAVAGLQAVGALRGALLLATGPLNLLFVGATFAFVPEGVRLLRRSPELLSGAMRRLGLGVALIALAWSLVAIAIPDALGEKLLGSTWTGAEPLLPYLTLFAVSLGAYMGAAQGLLALRAARRSLFVQLVGLAVSLPAVAAGAALAGARGAALSTGLASVLRSALGWLQFARALREPPDSEPEVRAQEAESDLAAT